jgi:hypothetical protein
MKVLGKISRRSRASVVLPLEEHPLMPTTMAFLFSIFGRLSGCLQLVDIRDVYFVSFSLTASSIDGDMSTADAAHIEEK